MIEVALFDDAGQVLAAAGSFLESRPVEHNLILTLLHERAATPEPGRYWVATDDGRVTGVVFQSPLHFHATTTPMPAVAAEGIAEEAARTVSLPGVMGEAGTAARFAGQWTEVTKSAAKPVEGARIYELGPLVLPPSVPGRIRRADRRERDLLFSWGEDFAAENVVADATRLVDIPLADQRLWVWDDDGPVSMSNHSAPVAGVTRLAAVYTPPQLRNRGYASACVGALSQRLVDAGHTCMLYTDLSNPVSNSVYRRLGYEAVCEIVRYEFTRGPR